MRGILCTYFFLLTRLRLCRDCVDMPVVHVHQNSQLAIAHVLSVLLYKNKQIGTCIKHIEGCMDGSSKNHRNTYRSTGVQNPQRVHLHLHSFEVYT